LRPPFSTFNVEVFINNFSGVDSLKKKVIVTEILILANKIIIVSETNKKSKIL
jgi:hypothetical protein